MKSTTRNRALPTIGAMALLLAGAAGADTYGVDRFDDSTANACNPLHDNDCALRGAILRANANPGDDLVRLQAGTYTLSIPGVDEDSCQTGDLDVTDTVVIVGRGPERTIIDAGGDGGVNDRVVDVHAPGERLTLRGLTVTGGSPDPGVYGGGIRAHDGSLRLETCVVAGNENNEGGTAIFSESAAPGDLTEVVDSWITANTGPGQMLYSRPPVRIERTTVSGNTQWGTGATVEIYADASLLVDSTIGGNTGGVPVSISGSAVVIEGCTLGDGGAALRVATSGSATVSTTLLAGSCAGAGQLTTLGGNLESPGDTCGLGGSDLVNVPDPMLSTLDWFGGPTPVHRPLPGSPAVDQPIAAAGCLDVDQRSLSRPRDGDGNASAVCDIGAVELAGPGELFVETFDCGFTSPWSDVVP